MWWAIVPSYVVLALLTAGAWFYIDDGKTALDVFNSLLVGSMWPLIWLLAICLVIGEWLDSIVVVRKK